MSHRFAQDGLFTAAMQDGIVFGRNSAFPIGEATTEEATVPSAVTSAAAVSSHEVSIPRIT